MNTTGDPLEMADAFVFYRRAMAALKVAGVPFLLGGAYAFARYTGITRHTKDLDVFVRPGDAQPALAALTAAGYRAELVFSHWLGKAFHDSDFIDVIFNSGNALCPVDDAWFEHAVAGQVLGVDVQLVPAEEMIWQKAFIQERERYDGADVIHLLRARGRRLDWDRMLTRFGPNWRVLLSHLILFGFVYPDDRRNVPEPVLRALAARPFEEPADGDTVCRGPLLSRTQYLTDTEEWGFADPRLEPAGPLNAEQLTRWTDAGR
ncbi:MAG: hypothetical protein ACJ8F7_23635 [Gemmataceae bacterium]